MDLLNKLLEVAVFGFKPHCPIPHKWPSSNLKHKNEVLPCEPVLVKLMRTSITIVCSEFKCRAIPLNDTNDRV